MQGNRSGPLPNQNAKLIKILRRGKSAHNGLFWDNGLKNNKCSKQHKTLKAPSVTPSDGVKFAKNQTIKAWETTRSP